MVNIQKSLIYLAIVIVVDPIALLLYQRRWLRVRSRGIRRFHLHDNRRILGQIQWMIFGTTWKEQHSASYGH
jgi:hypothetical protein